METWQPISVEEIEALVAKQLSDCSPEIQNLFERFKITPYRAKIDRMGTVETVFVVAKAGNIALYYEDVEDGFNVSELLPDGAISFRSCEQWELRHALWHLAAV